MTLDRIENFSRVRQHWATPVIGVLERSQNFSLLERESKKTKKERKNLKKIKKNRKNGFIEIKTVCFDFKINAFYCDPDPGLARSTRYSVNPIDCWLLLWPFDLLTRSRAVDSDYLDSFGIFYLEKYEKNLEKFKKIKIK